MADSGVWDRLTDSSKQAFKWARAVSEMSHYEDMAHEPDHEVNPAQSTFADASQGAKVSNPQTRPVTSETLLVGIMQAHRGTSEPQQLLEHFGLSERDLYEAIKQVTGLVIAVPLRLPDGTSSLGELPEHDDDVEEILSEAYALAQRHNKQDNGELIRLQDLFGGVLFTAEAEAYLALFNMLQQAVAPVSIYDIAKVYPEYLESEPSTKFADFLSEKFPPESREVNEPFDTYVVADEPSETDILGHRHLVNGLYLILNNARTQFPLAIGVTARWGAGKSSVMRQLKNKLRSPPAWTSRRWYVVDFPAWKYEKSERLWAALTKAIYEQPVQGMGWLDSIRFRFLLEWRRWNKWPFLAKGIGVPMLAGIAAAVMFLLPNESLGAMGGRRLRGYPGRRGLTVLGVNGRPFQTQPSGLRKQSDR